MDTLNAIVAHGLLGPMALVTGSLYVLIGSWDELSETERRELLQRGERHAQFVGDVLGEMARGLPVDIAEALRSEGS